jgi:hypothetical protein
MTKTRRTVQNYLLDTVVDTNSGLAVLTASNTVTGATHDNIVIHTVDTNGRIVLDTQINVFVNTETKVTGGGPVTGLELVFLDLQTTFKDFLGLGTADSDVNGDLFVTTDGESTDGVTGLGVDGGLTGQLFKYLGGTSKSITRLTDTNVENQLLNLEVAHGVLGNLLFFGALQ